MFGSAFATAAYMKYNLKFPEDKYAYIIGEKGLEHELDAVGIKHKGGSVRVLAPLPKHRSMYFLLHMFSGSRGQCLPTQHAVRYHPTRP